MSTNRDLELIEQARRMSAKARSQSNARREQSRTFATSFGNAHTDSPALQKYEIHNELHRGGQGVVFLATQKAARRKVAIKFLRSGPLAGAAERARFEREIQVLGHIRHPAVVTIHNSGVAEGSFYYVMDYIDGLPVDEFARRERPDSPRALRIIADICDAVAAAHLRGIIHRDLKPNNILIDAEDKPHILDFGLAKLAAEDEQATGVTQTGQFVGSLPWASPEQAEGRHTDLDVRTDVYSLGVVAYQILVGRHPYDTTGSWRDVTRRIANEAPRPMNIDGRAIDADVETIIRKCLEKEPARRYQSAAELAADIRRHLAGEPIAARRDSAMYVLRKTLRRYRAAIIVASCFVAFITVAAVTLAVLYQSRQSEWRRAEEQTAVAREERDRAERNADQARARFRMARDSLAFMLDQVGRRLLNLAGASELRKELLDKTYEQLAALSEDAPGDPILRYEIAKTRLRLHHVAANERADNRAAREHLDAATRIVEELIIDQPDNTQFLALMCGLLAAGGQMHEKAGELPEARARYERENKLSERIRVLDPENISSIQRLAGSCGRLATLAQLESNTEQAVHWITLANDLSRELVEKHPGNPDFQYYVFVGEHRLASIELAISRVAAAKGRLETLYADAAAIASANPGDARFALLLSAVCSELTEIARRDGDNDRAILWMQRRYEVNQALAERDPANPTYRTIFGDAALKLARVSLEQVAATEAMAYAREAATHLRDITALEPANRAVAMSLASALVVEARSRLLAPKHELRLVGDLLNEARRIFEAVPDETPSNPEFLADHAEALLTLAELPQEPVLIEAGEMPDALRRKALVLMTAAAERADSAGYTLLVERYRKRLGELKR